MMTVDIYKPNANDSLSLQELRLYHEIMAYRTEKGLGAIPLSKGLTTTAGRHVVDTYENFWVENRAYEPGANLHSWSDRPYYSNHSDAAGMWTAPERLGTGFLGNGYEISGAGYVDVTAALNGWKGSSGHNNVIINGPGWSGMNWQSIGIGVLHGNPQEDYQGKVYHVWFSDTADPSVPDILGTADADDFTGTTFRDRLFGRGGADSIQGGAGNDRIEGGAGHDLLTGGMGQDNFVFTSARGASSDQITDFDGADDQIWLAKATFAALGASVAVGELRQGVAAQDGNDHLIYDRASGRLWYDANGDDKGGVALLARFAAGRALTAADFDMI
jgi:Ca2+-binding RTX toxin-like protein